LLVVQTFELTARSFFLFKHFQCLVIDHFMIEEEKPI